MRFLLFGGLNYYPLGGFKDYLGCSGSLNRLKAASKELVLNNFDTKSDLWAHIVDAQTKIIVANFVNRRIPHKIDGYTSEYEFVELESI